MTPRVNVIAGVIALATMVGFGDFATAQQSEIVTVCVPTLLFWRITTGLYYSLRAQAGFPTAFGESFQAYAGEVLHQRMSNPAMQVLGEAEYHVGQNRKDSIDWIVQEGDAAALFVECKTMRLTWAPLHVRRCSRTFETSAKTIRYL